MSIPFLIYLYRTSLGECTVLGISLGNHLSTTLINVYRRFYILSRNVCIGSGACLYCVSIAFMFFSVYTSMHSLYASLLTLYEYLSLSLFLSVFLLLSYIVLIYIFLSVLI
ncbi:hypothetical protein BRC2024_EJDNWAKA_CDS_0022 [Acinetobacter phage vB_AbaP_Fanak]